MEEKKHIDRLFQEKLKDLEVFPETYVWKNIEQELTKRKKRRIVPLWLSFGSAAAVLLLLISTGVWYFNQPDTLTNPNNTVPDVIDNDIVQPEIEGETDQIINAEQTENETVTKQENSSSQNKSASSSETKQVQNSTITQPINSTKTNLVIAQQENDETSILTQKDQVIKEKDLEANQQINISNKELIKKETNAIVNNQSPEPNDFQLTKDDITEAIEDQLNEQKNIDDDKVKKWSLGTAIAPVYFNSLSDGSPINTSLASNDKEANTSLSYGVKVNYHINDRLSLQSGINNVELAYKTQGVTALIASSELQLLDTNIDTNINGVNLIAVSNSQVAAQSSELGTQRGIVNLSGDLNQSLSYIEIPMEAKYALVNRKFGVHVVGGVSTYVLYRNKISLLNQNGSTTLGEASNINDVNFSGNLGLDLDYKLNKKLFINVSPMFKYQMNTFSKNDGGFKPYYLGIYTGLNFRF